MATHDIVIRTPRLILRWPCLEDAQAMFRKKTDVEVLRYTSRHPDTDIAVSVQALKAGPANPLFFCFTIVLASDVQADTNKPPMDGLDPSKPTIIGSCGGHRLPQACYMLERVHWGKGYASEAFRGFLEAYWKTFPEGNPGLEGDEKHFIDLHIVPANSASLSVARKCGFALIGQEEVDNEREAGKIVLDIWRAWRPGYKIEAQ